MNINNILQKNGLESILLTFIFTTLRFYKAAFLDICLKFHNYKKKTFNIISSSVLINFT